MSEEHKPLGFRPGPADSRDWPLRDTLERAMAAPDAIQHGSKFYYSPSTLRQKVGSCVGHGDIHILNSSPNVKRLGYDDAMRVYDLAQRKYDPWSDTPPEEGTSVRAGAMAMRELGLWKGFAMAYGDEDLAITLSALARFILNHGPCGIGVSWYEGMDAPNPERGHFIRVEGAYRGGHYIEVDGVHYSGNAERDYWRLHQSWGEPWGFKAYGHGGFCRISWRDMQRLLEEDDATICSPVEAP